MPNYAHCKLTVIKKETEKSKTEFEEFQKDNIIFDKEYKKGTLTYERLLPMPKELNITSPQHDEADIKQAEINLKKYGAKDWYDWRNKWWGAKWGPDTDEIITKDNEIVITFDSPWVPPEGYLNKIAETYPNLKFEFSCSEESGNFDGKGKVKNGTWDWKINRPASWYEKMINNEGKNEKR